MAIRYIKTDIGRDEIRARVHAITRTARNLLLIIDASRSGTDWVGMVRGATDADLQTLLEAGLIAPAGQGGAPVSQPPPVPEEVVQTESALSYSELYDLLPSLAKEHLGLLKGYRFALLIEKANGVGGLQQVARELIAEVDRVKGPGVARAVKRALLM